MVDWIYENIIKIFDNEILLYLFGLPQPLVSVVTRLFIYHVSRDERLATAIKTCAGILFAFATNITIVFKQRKERAGFSASPITIARSGTFIPRYGLDRDFCQAVPKIIG